MNSTVLLVEDSADDYFLMLRAFRRAEVPANLRAVENGLEAIAYLSAKGKYWNRTECPLPVLILSDLKMPRMDGLELLAWVKAKTSLKPIPFIMLTTSRTPCDVDRAYELGANSYLTKPARFSQLVEMCGLLQHYWLRLNQADPK